MIFKKDFQIIFKYSLELKNVSFAYTNKNVLQNINLKIKTLLGKTRDKIKSRGSIVNEITTRGDFIKKIRDFADLSSDELIGGYDEIKGKKIRIDGYLEEFSLSRKEADELIMAAREIAYK